MFNSIVIAPLLNAIVFIVEKLPNHDLWIAMAVVTIIFKTILLPLFKKQSRDQIVMQHIAPKMKELQEKMKENRENLAKESLALYKKYKINPFTSILILVIQLPFLIGLYQIFYYGVPSYVDFLYSGVILPENINYHFFGMDLAAKNILLALIAGVSQYVLGMFMFKTKTPEEIKNEGEFVAAMNTQMKYVLPIVIAVVCYVTPAVIALYIIITNIYGIFQEIIIKKPLEVKVKKELAEIG